MHDSGKGRARRGAFGQKLLGHVAEIAVFAIDAAHLFARRPGQFADQASQQPASGSEHTLIPTSKRPAVEENGSVKGIFDRQRLQRIDNKADFILLLVVVWEGAGV